MDVAGVPSFPLWETMCELEVFVLFQGFCIFSYTSLAFNFVLLPIGVSWKAFKGIL
jgi:hypothetical protein